MEYLDDTQMFHQQQQEERQWLAQEYDIAFGGFEKDFEQFVMTQEEKKNERT